MGSIINKPTHMKTNMMIVDVRCKNITEVETLWLSVPDNGPYVYVKYINKFIKNQGVIELQVPDYLCFNVNSVQEGEEIKHEY